MKAGAPDEKNDHEKKEVEGITIYVPKDLGHENFEISWFGFWIFGQFTVKSLEVA